MARPSSVTKPLYANETPLPRDLAEEDEEIEITLEPDDEGLGLSPDISAEIESDLEETNAEAAQDHDANLADHLDDSDLQALSNELTELFEEDKESRSEWLQVVDEGIELLGFKLDSKEEPFIGACSASHPLLAESVVKFQAKAYKELFPAAGPARTRIMGTYSEEKERQAKRVKDFINYQTTVQMTEYGSELDRLLFYVGFAGDAYKKTYYDTVRGRPASVFVKPHDFVIDYYATSLETAPRYTHCFHMTSNDIRRNVLAGAFRDVDLGENLPPSRSQVRESEDALHGIQPGGMTSSSRELLEIHVELDLAGFEHPDGLLLPYVVTIDYESDEILAIRRNWTEGDQQFMKLLWFTHYVLIPGMSFYGYGYIHLIGGLSKTATASLQQLVDAGTFANLPAGFKAAGLRVLAPDEPIQPGEWREMNAPAGDIQKALMPLPYKEPSATLMNLLQFVDGTGREFADATDQIVQEASNYGPVGTTMALLEQGNKLYSAIHKRLHDAQGRDLKILARINHDYLPDSYPYEVSGNSNQILSTDFDPSVIDVIPVSDPNMPTEAHRISKINAIMSIAGQDPQAHNMNQIRKDLYGAMGVEEPERYLAEQAEPFSGDPISENAKALMGSPLKSQLEHNHEAHIIAHKAMLDNPVYSEQANMRQTLLSHIAEHLAQKYTKDMLQNIPDPQLQQAILSGKPLPPEVGNQVSMMAAEASDLIYQMDIARSKILSGESPDELVQVQQRELDIREAKQQQEYTLKMIKQEHEEKVAQAKLLLEELKLLLDDEDKTKNRDQKQLLSEVDTVIKALS